LFAFSGYAMSNIEFAIAAELLRRHAPFTGLAADDRGGVRKLGTESPHVRKGRMCPTSSI
jgi:hypothetical protein